jgi:opacity protein-like surface antigen
VGGGAQLQEDIAPGLEADGENSSLASTLNLLFGMVLGVDLGRHLSLEVAAEGHEINLRSPGLGTVGELSMYALTPQVRLRYPLLDGRLVPYLVGGVGVGYAEVNDLKAPSTALNLKGKDFAPIAAVGLGLDWFFADNLSVELQTRYRYSRDHEIQVGPRTEKLDLDAVLTTVGLTIHFP